MARGGAALLLGVAAAVAASALRVGQPSDRPQGPIGHRLVPNRSYVFMTHRKTGTNLMARIAELTSLMAFGEFRNSYCLRVYRPTAGSIYPSCVVGVAPSGQPVTAPMNFTFNAVFNVNGDEMWNFLDAVPNIRVVHMVRDPKMIAISDYQYEMFLHSPDAPDDIKWDTLLGDENFTNASGIMRRVAKQTHKEVGEIASTNWVVAGDPRVLKIDLDSIAGNFDSFSTRMYNHLFDDLSPQELDLLVTSAASQDLSRWKEEQFKGVTAASHMISRRAALEVWEALRQAGDEDVLNVMSDSRDLGY